MNNDFYKRLVDLYAGDELPQELKEQVEALALTDADLAQDAFTLKNTVSVLRGIPAPEFNEQTDIRIRLLMSMRGAEFQESTSERPGWQYHLPIQP